MFAQYNVILVITGTIKCAFRKNLCQKIILRVSPREKWVQETLLFFHVIKTKLPNSQLTFTCSKSTIETLEQGVKYVQS